MSNRWIRSVAAAPLLSTALGSFGCGYLLYPERRGNRGGSVDGGTLVMDLLWLIPGIIPGAVALIVDFTSGAMYRSHGDRYAVTIPPDGRVAVLLPESPQPAQLEVRLTTSAHRVVARRTALVGPQLHKQTVELQIEASAQLKPHEQIYLEVVLANEAAASPASTPATP
jgi:hypothetical protein